MAPEGKNHFEEIEKEQKIINRGLVRFRKRGKEKVKSFLDFYRDSQKGPSLPNKFRELIRLCIVVEEGCKPCILKHLKLCFDAGCSEEEIVDAMIVLLSMRGGMVYEYIGFVMESVEYIKEKKEV